MSDYKEYIEVIVKTNAEKVNQQFNDLAVKVHQLQEEIKYAKIAQKELDEEFKRGAISEAEYNVETAKITKNLLSFNSELTKSQSKLNDMNKSQWTKFKEGVGAADSKLGGFLKTAGKLIKNPYALTIGAIVAAFVKLRNAIKQSDNAGTAFARLGNALKTLFQPIERLIIGIAEGLGKAANAATDFIKSILPERLQKDAERLDDIVTATDRLQETEREYAINHAEREAEISQLRAEAAIQNKHTIEERIDMLQKAGALEADDLRDRKRIADEKIRIFNEETANQKSLSDAQKDELTKLTTAKKEADREYAESQRRLNRSLNPLVNELIEKASDLSLEWSKVAEEIDKVFQGQLKLNLQNFLKDNADAVDGVLKSLDNLENYMSDEDYERVMAARTKILSGYYKSGVEGAKEFKEGVEELSKVIPKEFENTANSTKQIAISVSDAYIKIAEDYEKEVSTTTNKALQNRKKAINKSNEETIKKEQEAIEQRDRQIKQANTKNVQSNKEANEEILKQHVKTVELELKALEDAANQLKGKNKEVAQAGVEYLRTVTNANNEILELEKKKATSEAELKRLTEELKNAELELATTNDETLVGSLETFIATTDLAITSAEQAINAYSEQIAAKQNEMLQASRYYTNKLADIDEYYESKKLEILNKYSKIRVQSWDEQSKNEIDSLQEFRNQDLISEEEFQKKKLEIQKYYNQEKSKEQVEAASQMLGSFAEVSAAIASAYHQEYENIVIGKEELTKKEADAAVEALEREKAATIAQLALQQAQAIGFSLVAAASAAAQSGVAAAFVYAATAASLTAGIISSIVSANQAMKNIDAQIAEVKSKVPQYATGGYITGAGTGTSDSIPARLSNGESVINARSTARFYDLLSAINQAGGGVAFPNAMSVPQLNFATGGVAQSYENTYRMLENAVANIQPVVSVKEITKVQNRLKAKEII